MAKSLYRIQAREMRSRGESIKEIAKNLSISKSTVSLWVRDIILSAEQLEKLRNRSIKGAELGRLKSSLRQKEKRLKKIEESKKEGIRRLKRLTIREFLIAGVSLYWAEGTKKRRRVEFCNSDPELVKFMVKWILKYFGLEITSLRCYVGINEIHKDREKIVKGYWSGIAGIPLSQFSKTSFKKTINKKIYKNFNEHFGTLSVRVTKPAEIYYKIMGLIDGLSEAEKNMAR